MVMVRVMCHIGMLLELLVLGIVSHLAADSDTIVIVGERFTKDRRHNILKGNTAKLVKYIFGLLLRF